MKSEVVDLETLREAIEDTLNAHPPRPQPGAELEITRTQADVLKLIAQGKSNVAIAAERHCSVRFAGTIEKAWAPYFNVQSGERPRSRSASGNNST